VHRAGVLAQTVGEQLELLLAVDGNVVIADFRDYFLGFLIIGRHFIRGVLLSVSFAAQIKPLAETTPPPSAVGSTFCGGRRLPQVWAYLSSG
jgi:hypothetical protein